MKSEESMKMRALLVLMLLAAAQILSAAELLTETADSASWKGMVKPVPESARGRGPCFELYGKYPTALVYQKLIPVDPAKTYVLKVSFRSVSAELPASAYLGAEIYDEQKRLIAIRNVWVRAGSESQVVCARAGEKSLTVRMIPDFAKFKSCVVAFGAKKDGSDLPNFDLSSKCSGMKPDENGESGSAAPRRAMRMVHAAPRTIGQRILSATNSRPERSPSNPAATSIQSAVSICFANIGRETSLSRFPTKGRSILNTIGIDRSWRRPSASVT